MPRTGGLGPGEAHLDRQLALAAFDSSELAPLQAVPWNVDRLASRMEAGDSEVAWLGELVPPRVLRAYPGGEALAVPALARAAAAYAVATEAERSWFAMMRRALEHVAEGGAGRHATLQSGVSRELIDDNATQVVFIAGAAGGSGRGLLIPAAAAATVLARRVGQINAHAFLVYGPYRPIDGQEGRKAALTQSLMMDIERVMTPEAVVRFPIGPGRVIETTGRLFETVGGIDASGRLRHNEQAIAQCAVESLWFQYATQAGFRMAKSRSNIRYRARVLGGVSEPHTS
jgi:hypothetical protein